jgi:hypothetical protein
MSAAGAPTKSWNGVVRLSDGAGPTGREPPGAIYGPVLDWWPRGRSDAPARSSNERTRAIE